MLIAGEFAASIVSYHGLQVELCSPRAFPPGHPLQLTIAAVTPALELEARSLGSKRAADGSYQLRLRLVNLRKDTRLSFERAWASVEGG